MLPNARPLLGGHLGTGRRRASGFPRTVAAALCIRAGAFRLPRTSAFALTLLCLCPVALPLGLAAIGLAGLTSRAALAARGLGLVAITRSALLLGRTAVGRRTLLGAARRL